MTNLTDLQIKAQSDSVQVDILQAEIIRLRGVVIDLRFNGTKPADDYPSLMRFLDDVVRIVAKHPDAQAAPAYFMAMLQQARERVE